MVTVRDYNSTEQKWEVWQAESLQTAYADYPFGDSADLAGYLAVTNDLRDTQGAAAIGDLTPRSVWTYDVATDDIVAGFHLAGHTGLWAIEVREPAQDERAVRGLIVEGDDYTVEGPGDAGGALFTLDLIEIYPIADGLPDSLWLDQNNEIVLNTPSSP